ncbi:hypothetical protein CSC26_4389 [Pseudomonas aeruginosa]|nr:hypothetical protein CSC26_4389 [Pseudomonas aeruginosa]
MLDYPPDGSEERATNNQQRTQCPNGHLTLGNHARFDTFKPRLDLAKRDFNVGHISFQVDDPSIHAITPRWKSALLLQGF